MLEAQLHGTIPESSPNSTCCVTSRHASCIRDVTHGRERHNFRIQCMQAKMISENFITKRLLAANDVNYDNMT